MLCRDGVQQKQVKVRGGIRWIITTEKTREIRCSHCNRLLAKGECSILSGNAPVRDPLHTVCHSILYSKFFIPKLNGVVHKIVWRVTALSAVLAFLFYRYLPFSLEIRQAMAVIALAPSSSLALIFTMKLKGDVIMAGNICSLSILLSTIAMTILLVYL